ncbi:MAG: tetratricopeptide repeat protein [Elusimicrobia bacterium]|nr:tetratricopeptide repeat protein [Elusimicrobiota bacterium]
MPQEPELNPETAPVEEVFLLSVQTDDHEKKRALRRAIAARDTESCYGLFSLAWLMAENRTGDSARVISLYSEALKLNPDFWLARFERANTRFDNNLLDEALSDYEDIIKEGIEEPNLHYNAALIRAKQERFDDAKKYYDSAIALDPGHGPAYFGRAAVFIHDRKYKEASADLAKAVECDPDNPVYHTTHGLTFINLSKMEEAEKELGKAIKLSPKDPKLYNFRANLYVIMGEYTMALADAAAILLLDPADFHACEMLGGLLLAHRRPGEALWALQRALELDPANERVKAIMKDKKLEGASPVKPDLKELSALGSDEPKN